MMCYGICKDKHTFHARCVGLTYDEGCACLHSNIFWMCDPCRHAIEYERFGKSASDINTEKLATKDEVKAEVERIDKILTQLTSHLQSIEICGELSSNSINLSTSSPPPLSSTKNNVEHLANEQPSVAMQNSSLQLYISNIANDVTEDEIGSMVCEALGAKRVLNVKCLVSPWKDISTLDYVSFKVVVGAQYRKAAFAATNWPTGVRI